MHFSLNTEIKAEKTATCPTDSCTFQCLQQWTQSWFYLALQIIEHKQQSLKIYNLSHFPVRFSIPMKCGKKLEWTLTGCHITEGVQAAREKRQSLESWNCNKQCSQ